MSTLAFTSPDLARAEGDFAPVARSAMERRQRDAGARFEERHGWLVPVGFPGEADRLESVGVADLSHLVKFEVRGTGERLEGEGIVWYAITPERALVLAPAGRTGWLRDRLERAFPFVLDVTGAYAVLALAGPQAPSVLRRLTHLHELPASGSVARVPGHVLDQGGGYWILVAQEYGHYLWEVAADAAAQLDGGPVGIDAIQGRPA